MTENPRDHRTNPPTRFLRLPEVLVRTGLSRSTIYVRLAEGSFPRPVPLGPRAVGWIEAEVDGWIRDQIAQRRSAGAAAGGDVAAEFAGARRRPEEAVPVR